MNDQISRTAPCSWYEMDCKHRGFPDAGLLAPPLICSFNELTLSTASLLANASSTQSGHASDASINRDLNSPFLTPTKEAQRRCAFKYRKDEGLYLRNEMVSGSCSMINDMEHHERKVEMRRTMHDLDRSSKNIPRHNSTPSKLPLYSEDSRLLVHRHVASPARVVAASLPRQSIYFVPQIDDFTGDGKCVVNSARQEFLQQQCRAKFESWVMRSMDSN